MTGAITRRVHHVADTIGELKVRVRAVLATELASAVGTAVRDVLVVALLDRLIVPPRAAHATPPRPGGWREDYDRDRWGDPHDPWADDREEYDRREDAAPDRDEFTPSAPAAAAVAVGVTVGRWWLARRGTVAGALGAGVLAALLGLGGGPVARAALAVLAATADVLTAEAALARPDGTH
jgi:hypothetical protein